MSARAVSDPVDVGRWWAVAAISLSLLVVSLDLTVLSLALPKIATSMHASTSDLQWIVDSYSLVIAALILPAGLLGDRFGRKRILIGSLGLFLGCSVWTAYSAGVGELIAARALLGVGAAALFPMAIAVIPVLFAEEERQKAIAVLAAAMFVSYPLGPILGGFLLDHFWWGSVFLINVPVVAIALPAVIFLLPESRAQRRPGLDLPGIVISSAGLTAVTYGFIRASERGWADAVALGLMAAGALVTAAFVWWERAATRRAVAAGRGGQPLVDLSLFRLAGFRWGTILMTFVTFSMFGLMFTVPQFFQEIQGATPLGSGVRMLPLIGGMLVGLVAGNKLTGAPKRPDGTLGAPPASAKLVAGAGFGVMAAGLATGAFTTLSSSADFALLWVTITGAGLGLAMPSSMNAAVARLDAERSASGGALLQAARQVGGTIGVAVLGTIISNAYASRLTLAGLPAAAADTVRSGVAGGVAVADQMHSPALLGMVRTAFIGGMDVMLWTCAGIALASALLAAAFLPRGLRSAPLAAGDGGAAGRGNVPGRGTMRR
ncbi:MAG TPA: MFS transporter [Trebonia sp.]|nr:MFS transporter [Trebonia sp.]